MKPINGYPDYFVDESGIIYSRKFHRKISGSRRSDVCSMRILKPWIALNKYWMVRLQDSSGKKKNRYVHDLVLETFIGPRPKGFIALHGKKGSFINSIDNLSWGTYKENTHDMLRDNTMSWGERHPISKLTNEQAKKIRSLHSTKREHGMTNREISELFGVCPQLISKIGLSRCWKYL